MLNPKNKGNKNTNIVNINIEKKQIIKPESPTLAMKRNRHPKKGDIYIMTKYFKNVRVLKS